MANEVEEIKQKINNFMDKKGLDSQSKYFITKALNEEYWDEIQEEPEEEQDELDEFEEDATPEEENQLEPEEKNQLEPEEDLEIDPKPRVKKNHEQGIKNILNMPKVKFK